MSEVATTPAAPSEAGVLAGELAKSFGEMVRIYERHFSLIKAAWDDWKGTKTSKIVITKPAPVGG